MAKIIDRDKLLDAADIALVAGLLGLRVETMGAHTCIECPNPEHYSEHTGKKLKNCYIGHRKDGTQYFKCYSCGAYGTAIDMVMMQLGLEYGDATKELSRMLTGSEDSFKTDSTPTYELRKKLLSRDDYILLGLCRPDQSKSKYYAGNAVYGEIAPIDVMNGKYPEPDNLVRRDRDYGTFQCEVLDQTPLLSLMRDDEEAYRWLIRSKAEEKLAALREIEFPDYKQVTATGATFGEVIQTLGPDTYRTVIRKMIRRLEDICIEYDADIKKKNIFI